LIGTENRGLNHMFTFINTSRVGTAMQGVAAAERSFQQALAYATERLAMRSLTGTKNPDGPADPIIVHPDVRKMLLTQKCFAEGGRSMIYECAKLIDLMQDAQFAGDEKKAKQIDEEMGFLTPILKGFLTEKGSEAANLGVQVYGGHGYIKSNQMEQVVRDIKIGTIWEGTTGIQALDLLGRKVMMQKLKPTNDFCAQILGECGNYLTDTSALGAHARSLYSTSIEWQVLTAKIALGASSNKDVVGSASVDYLMYSGYVTMALHWLRMEAAAKKALEGDCDDPDYYNAKIDTADFYFNTLLPRTRSLATTMTVDPKVMMKMDAQHFALGKE